MRTPAVKNLTPALVGLGALLVYILACTSFSPDDSKVLYATWNATSGGTGVAVYDRKAGTSELLFQPTSLDVPNLKGNASILRPQWIDDGHGFLTAWASGKDGGSDTSLNIAILPFDRRAPARVFQVPELGNDGGTLYYYWPLPVAGKNLFLLGQSNTIVRLNYETGEMRRQTNETEVIPVPSPDNDHLFYLSGLDNSNGPSEYGLLDPETLARTPLFHILKGKLSLLSIALSRDGRSFAYQVENENPPVVHLIEAGKPARTLSLASLGAKTDVNVRQFSPKGDLLYASFKNTADANTNAEFGFLEIPLDGSPIRKTVLLNAASEEDGGQLASFQVDLSHDGKTLAVESLWLAGVEKHPLRAEDCALFLVDLSDPQRKVTKVPIPLPLDNKPISFPK